MMRVWSKHAASWYYKVNIIYYMLYFWLLIINISKPIFSLNIQILDV